MFCIRYNLRKIYIISETNCISWQGQKYVQCPDSSECIRFINESQIENECLKQRNNQENDVNAQDSKWKCTDGFPIDINLVCNGASDCDDSSDEMTGNSLKSTIEGAGLLLICNLVKYFQFVYSLNLILQQAVSCMAQNVDRGVV